MQKRRRIKQTKYLEERLAEEAKELERTLRVLKEPQSNEGHERIIEGSCALDVIAAERNVMDHLVTT